MENAAQVADVWDSYMYLGTTAFAVLTVLLFIYHEIRVISQGDYKARYDYVTNYEIKFFWYTVITAIIAATFISNSFMSEWILQKGMKWFWGRVFLTVCLAILTYFIFQSLIKIYYVRYMERKLDRLRNKPRQSPEGNDMRKLSESEEDAHLEADQIAQEGSEVHSVDYDVWIDDKTGYKKIEKYYSYQHAIECPECGYVTLKIDHEDITTAPTQSEAGLLTKHYRCSFCNHRTRKEVQLSKLADNVV
jgi:hypothetical protein